MNLAALALASFSVVTGLEEPPRGKALTGRLDEIRRGMTPNEVRTLLGAPSRMCRQVLAQRHLEQWHYEDLGWVEFDYVRGEKAVVFQKGRLP
jgi:hypothetical protein